MPSTRSSRQRSLHRRISGRHGRSTAGVGCGPSLLNDQGERRMHLADLYRLPADTPQHETILAPGDLITAVLLPANSAAPHSHYLKVRDLASFEWAPVSIAVALEMEDRRVCRARIVAGVEASAGRGGAVQGRPL